MRLLIVKMSSLGDVVHMLPAVTDAVARHPGLVIDWVVEEGFAAIPAMHPAVHQVLPIALRRWRKAPFSATNRKEFARFITQLRDQRYDWIIDTQGLIKSAAVSLFARGKRGGHAFGSVRETLAAIPLHKRVDAPRALHAITRNRLTMAGILGYTLAPDEILDYGIQPPAATNSLALPARYLVALHGTARAEKEYPVEQWQALISRLAQAGYPVVLPWGHALEKQRAEILAGAGGQVLPKLDIPQLAAIIAGSTGIVGVDTGLMHLAAALHKPGVGLYPATDPVLYGAKSEPGAPVICNLHRQEELAPERVADTLLKLLPA